MLKRISVHKLLLILVIALIARPAMSVMAHDSNMAMGQSDTAIHCHDQPPENCHMSLTGNDTHQVNCDKCSDSCSASVFAMVSGSNKSVALEHPLDSSSLFFVLSRRNDEPFRPPIHS